MFSSRNQNAVRSSPARGFGAPSTNGTADSIAADRAGDSGLPKKKKRHEATGSESKTKSSVSNRFPPGNVVLKGRTPKAATRQPSANDPPPRRPRQQQRGRLNSKTLDPDYRPTSSSSSSSSSSSHDPVSRGELADLATGTNDYAKRIHDQLRKDGVKPPRWPSDPGNPRNKAAMVQFKERYKSYRDQARTSLMKAGLIDNPNDRKRLEDAIDFKGVCEYMCPDYEKIVRMTEFDVTSAEKDTDTGWPVLSRMVKKLARSAAGQEAPLPMDVRSIAALRRTLDYLVGELLPSDEHLKRYHGFLWDRTRAIRRDFAFFSTISPQELVDQVYCLENTTRFHVTSLHLLSQPGQAPEDYSEHQEVEQLGNSLMSLKYAYDDCRNRGVSCSNEAEFRAYELLVRANQPNILETAQREWGPELWQQSDVARTAVSLVKALHRTYSFHEPSTKGPSAAAKGAHHPYFRILESPKVSYTMACTAEMHFGQLRRSILQSVKRAPPMDITAETLNQRLAFDSVDEAIEFAEKCGLQFEPSLSDPFSKRHHTVVLDNSPLAQFKVHHQFSRRFVESKRGTHSVAELMRRTVFPNSDDDGDENGLFVPQTNGFGSLGQSSSAAVSDSNAKGNLRSPKPKVRFAEQLAQTETNGSGSEVPASSKISSTLPTSKPQFSFGFQKPTHTPAAIPDTTTASSSSLPSSSFSSFVANPFAARTEQQATAAPVNPFLRTQTAGTAPKINPFTSLGAAENTTRANDTKSHFATSFASGGSASQKMPVDNASVRPPFSVIHSQSAGTTLSSSAFAPPSKRPISFQAAPSPVLGSQTAALGGTGLPRQAGKESAVPAALPNVELSNGFAKEVATFRSPPSLLAAPSSGPKPVQPSNAQAPSIQITPPTPVPPFAGALGARMAGQQQPPPNLQGLSKTPAGPQSAISQTPGGIAKPEAKPLPPAELGQQSTQLLPLSSATAASTSPAPAQPAISKEQFFKDFTGWFVNGDRGIIEEFEVFAIERLVSQVFREHKKAGKQKRRQDAKEQSAAAAVNLRRRTLSVKYFGRWRDRARQSSLRRRCRSGRDEVKAFYAAKRAAEKKAADQKKQAEEAKKRKTVDPADEFASMIKKRRHSMREAEEAFLATGVLSGLSTDERATAAQMIKDVDCLPAGTNVTNSTKPRPDRGDRDKGDRDRGDRDRGDRDRGDREGSRPGRKLGQSVAAVDGTGSRVTKTSQFRRSLPPLPTRESFSTKQSPPPSERSGKPRRNPISDRWRLKAMGFVTLPDGSLGPEVLASSMRNSDSWSQTELLAKRLRRVSDTPLYGTARVGSSSPESMAPPPRPPPVSAKDHGSAEEGSSNKHPSKRKRPAEEGSEDGLHERAPPSEAGAKRRHGETDTERLIREMREMRAEMEAGTAWYREQNEMMQVQIASRSGTPW